MVLKNGNDNEIITAKTQSEAQKMLSAKQNRAAFRTRTATP